MGQGRGHPHQLPASTQEEPGLRQEAASGAALVYEGLAPAQGPQLHAAVSQKDHLVGGDGFAGILQSSLERKTVAQLGI